MSISVLAPDQGARNMFEIGAAGVDVIQPVFGPNPDVRTAARGADLQFQQLADFLQCKAELLLRAG